MFNSSIQKFINSSGEAAAITRARQLDSYINSIYENKNPIKTEQEEEFGSKPFNEVLKTSVEETQNKGSIFLWMRHQIFLLAHFPLVQK